MQNISLFTFCEIFHCLIRRPSPISTFFIPNLIYYYFSVCEDILFCVLGYIWQHWGELTFAVELRTKPSASFSSHWILFFPLRHRYKIKSDPKSQHLFINIGHVMTFFCLQANVFPRWVSEDVLNERWAISQCNHFMGPFFISAPHFFQLSRLISTIQVNCFSLFCICHCIHYQSYHNSDKFLTKLCWPRWSWI